MSRVVYISVFTLLSAVAFFSMALFGGEKYLYVAFRSLCVSGKDILIMDGIHLESVAVQCKALILGLMIALGSNVTYLSACVFCFSVMDQKYQTAGPENDPHFEFLIRVD